ncbi:porin, partial [Cronobacter dublinensis]
MKKSTLALVVMGIVASSAVQAAEVFNKDGNKVNIYGRVKAMHYMSDDAGNDGDKTYARLGFKGETQVNSDLTGYGQWEYEIAGYRAESESLQK